MHHHIQKHMTDLTNYHRSLILEHYECLQEE